MLKCTHSAAVGSRLQPNLPNASTRHLPFASSNLTFPLSPPLSDKYSPLLWLLRLTRPGREASRVRSGQVCAQHEIITKPTLLNYAILPFLRRRLQDCLRFLRHCCHFFQSPSLFLARNTLSRMQGLLK